MSRLPDIQSNPLSAAQQAIYDKIAAGPRGRVEGPLRIWLHSPELADRSQALGAFCRFGTHLPPRLSELTILIVGAHWRAGFEWHVHEPIARAAGISDAVIEALRGSSTPTFTAADERVLYEFTHQLVTDRKVDQGTFERARQLWGEVGVVELVGLIGYYTYISMTIVAFEIDVPGADPFADGE